MPTSIVGNKTQSAVLPATDIVIATAAVAHHGNRARLCAPVAKGLVLSKGFTLVELLVILAIIVLASAIVGPSVGRMMQKPKTPSPIDQFVNTLARLRDTAARQQKSFRGFINLEAQQLEDTRGQVLFQFPAQASIELTDLYGNVIDTSHSESPVKKLPCIFRADGSGCPLDLRYVDTTANWLISVDPITGRVRMRRFGDTDPAG